MTNQEVNTGRRRFLTATTAVVGAVGAGFAAVPFIKSWSPSARARFAGQCSEALMQIQLQRLDDHEITQNDAFERHAQDPPSFQRSFLRKVSK